MSDDGEIEREDEEAVENEEGEGEKEVRSLCIGNIILEKTIFTACWCDAISRASWREPFFTVQDW